MEKRPQDWHPDGRQSCGLRSAWPGVSQASEPDYFTAAAGASAWLRSAVASRFSIFMSDLASFISFLAWRLASFLRALYSALASASFWRFCTYGSLDWPELSTAVAFTAFGCDSAVPVPRVG